MKPLPLASLKLDAEFNVGARTNVIRKASVSSPPAETVEPARALESPGPTTAHRRRQASFVQRRYIPKSSVEVSTKQLERHQCPARRGKTRFNSRLISFSAEQMGHLFENLGRDDE